MSVPVAGTDAATPGAPAASVAPTVACADCGTPHSEDANFCPHCGQETRIKLPRVFDFLREAADETIGFSGRLPRTLGLLLFRPGKLTTEYIAGHRQRYVRPMRLYLSVSLVFFALLGVATSDGELGWIHLPTFAGESIENDDAEDGAKDKAVDASDAKRAAERAAAPAESDLPVVDLSAIGQVKAPPGKDEKPAASIGTGSNPDAGKLTARKKSDSKPPTDIPWLDSLIEKYRDMSRAQVVRTITQGVQANAPYAVFILMPLAAFWYQLFYLLRRRRYAEHLLHSVHLHCFAFCIGAMALLPWLAGWRWLLFWLLYAYAFWAERHVYRSGWLRAFFGTFIGSLLYFFGVVFMATVLAVLSFVSK